MRRTIHITALAGAAAVSLASAAHAADLSPQVYTAAPADNGFYFGTNSAGTIVDRTTFRLNGAVVRSNYEVDSFFSGRAGYAVGRVYGVLMPRIEAEVGYGRSAVKNTSVNGVRYAAVDSLGEARSIQGYGNFFIDLDLGYAVKPFVGGGVGAADVRLRRQGVSATGSLIDSSDAGLSYHYGAGLGFDLSRMGFPLGSSLLKGTVVEVGYRRTETPDLTFTARDGTKSKTDYKSDSVTFGARKAF